MVRVRTRNISDFFKNELTDYSSYSTIRMLASAIDGQKNSQRKILHTALHKLKSSTKVSVFDNQMQSFTQYLHGSSAGVVSNMAASYCGSNTLPLLKGEGNFGSRFVNDPAAPRYIYVSKPDYLDTLFDIRDVLIQQSFEGSQIEPLFYVPTIPLILVNGSLNGLASGFKQHILPRKLDDIIAYYQGKKTDLIPHIKGFRGTVERDAENPNKWLLKGSFTAHKNKVLITEIPPFIEYAKYLQILDDLQESKKIKSFKDLSNVKTQEYKFEVQLLKEIPSAKIFELLKLQKSEVEIYNCIDENNKVKTFENPQEILDYFKSVRLKFLESQRQFDIRATQTELLINASKYKFVQMIMSNELKVFKRPKSDIISDLSKTNLYRNANDGASDGGFGYLLNMQIHSFTNETLKVLASKVESLQGALKTLELKKVESEFIKKLSNTTLK